MKHTPHVSTSCAALASTCLSFTLLFACDAHSAQGALPDWAPKPKPRIVEDRVRAEVMLFGAGYDTTLRIDQAIDLLGTEINAEDDLALDDAELLPLVELTLLPGKRHLVRLSGLSSNRSAQTVLEREIVFDDEVYRIGERVDSELDLSMVGLTYGYRFLLRERVELAATLGVQVAEVNANAVVLSRVLREAESGVAPLPLLGVEGRYDVSRRWSVEGRAQYLTAHISDVDGELLDLRLAATWRMNPHLVFGLGYRYFNIDVNSRDEDTPGFFDLTLDGPMLYMRASL